MNLEELFKEKIESEFTSFKYSIRAFSKKFRIFKKLSKNIFIPQTQYSLELGHS